MKIINQIFAKMLRSIVEMLKAHSMYEKYQ